MNWDLIILVCLCIGTFAGAVGGIFALRLIDRLEKRVAVLESFLGINLPNDQFRAIKLTEPKDYV